MNRVITFGRFNPPTIGHDRVFETMKSLVEENADTTDARVYTSKKVDHGTNPLTYASKKKLLEMIVPEGVYVSDDNMVNNMFEAIERSLDEVDGTVHMVLGGDRFDELSKKIEERYDRVKVHNAGTRLEESAPTRMGASASLARRAVRDNNKELFESLMSERLDQKTKSAVFGLLEVALVEYNQPEFENVHEGSIISINDRAGNTMYDFLITQRFLRLLVKDFKDWEAYKEGIIDEKGNVLKKARDRKSKNEKEAFTGFHRLVWRIKRTLKLGKIGSMVAALAFIKEEVTEPFRQAKLEEAMLEYFAENSGLSIEFVVETIKEDAPTNSMANGGIATYDAPLSKKKKPLNRINK